MSESTPTILVVDDKHTNLRLMNAALKTEGYRVRLVDNADKALDVVASDTPDLIFLDINMPGMNGLELCEKLKSDRVTQDIPVIFLTALDDKKTILKGLSLGAVDYITKPFDVVLLLSRVKNHLQNKLRQDELRDASMKDSLTGLYNRAFIDQRLEQEISLASRKDVSFSIALLDIDHFKSINDEYGHQQGDEVLIRLSVLMQESFRKEDIVGRYGGEEFIIVLPATSQEQAFQAVDAFRQAVAAVQWDHSDQPVTVSGGVCDYADSDARVVELVANADCLLYQAKRQGRNRIVQGICEKA